VKAVVSKDGYLLQRDTADTFCFVHGDSANFALVAQIDCLFSVLGTIRSQS